MFGLLVDNRRCRGWNLRDRCSAFWL